MRKDIVELKNLLMRGR
ncbi:BnaC03g47660D [Brassica napus]|uniref:BnaC03g47660D protein n=1 Tax=Brassica napus TaxID=3708 RepID=A0A078F391_BRANA|nr:BnaC03g47660D [Brassica napus]